MLGNLGLHDINMFDMHKHGFSIKDSKIFTFVSILHKNGYVNYGSSHTNIYN